jgi:hypothetical protein
MRRLVGVLLFALLLPVSARQNGATVSGDALGAWTPLPIAGAPSPRRLQTAVWTGDAMIVWGGSGCNHTFCGDGASYTPATNAWMPISAVGAPSPRYGQSAIWIGTEMLLWGGTGQAGLFLGDGAAYNPTLDTWRPISAVGAPSSRSGQAAVWTGTEMLIWGGSGPAGPYDIGPLGDGAAYNPVTDTWRPLPAAGAPTPRDSPSALDTRGQGTQMLLWGGYHNGPLADGAAFNTPSQSWQPLPSSGAPSPRGGQVAVAALNSISPTGMIIWGGRASSGTPLNDGAEYDLSGAWLPLPTADAPSPRSGATGVWTGKTLLVWGGSGVNFQPLGDGGTYNPVARAWQPMPTIDAPGPRAQQSAVWTGQQMLIWGGATNDPINPTDLGDGAAYTPPSSAYVPRSPQLDGKIEAVWPHDAAGNYQRVDQAPLANIRVYLFGHDTRHPFCQDVPVDMLMARNNDPVQLVGISSGPPQRITEGAVTFLAWEFNNVDVAAARNPANRLYFTVGERVTTGYSGGVGAHVPITAPVSPNIWSHAVNALTDFPRQDTPTGVVPLPQVGGYPAVDLRIEIVWPHGNAPVAQARQVNVTAMAFLHGTSLSVAPDYPQPLLLERALNSAPLQPVILGRKRLVTAHGLTYPVWDFNDIDVSAARDPQDRYFFQVQEEFNADIRSNIWTHGTDGRTIFPAPDVPDRSCP